MNAIRSALVVDTNHSNDLLTRREFVWPIQRALSIPSKVIHLSKVTPKQIIGFDMVIFSGCMLRDHAYLKRAPKLAWLKSIEKPLLGVCAGQHLLASVYGGKIRAMKNPVIGVHPVRISHSFPFSNSHPLLEDFSPKFNAYFLHGNEAGLPKSFRSIAHSLFSKNEIIAHSQKPIAGFSFHPEVLNKSFFPSFVKWAESFSARD